MQIDSCHQCGERAATKCDKCHNIFCVNHIMPMIENEYLCIFCYHELLKGYDLEHKIDEVVRLFMFYKRVTMTQQKLAYSLIENLAGLRPEILCDEIRTKSNVLGEICWKGNKL